VIFKIDFTFKGILTIQSYFLFFEEFYEMLTNIKVDYKFHNNTHFDKR